ncbi:MAG: hypothetical protein ACI4RV_08215, partial [Eubacteriales bacterium]
MINPKQHGFFCGNLTDFSGYFLQAMLQFPIEIPQKECYNKKEIGFRIRSAFCLAPVACSGFPYTARGETPLPNEDFYTQDAKKERKC